MSQRATSESDNIKTVTRADLPLSCPMPGDEVWNMHPRVYLPVEKTGDAVCPYCGMRYRLAD
ncbi:MAG: zinc-finger domain-containing protein [Gammaproteobacteria bacterium]